MNEYGDDYAEAQDRIRGELEGDEKMLWAGKPDPKRSMLPTLPIMLFALPWTAFSIFWVTMALMAVRSTPADKVGPMILFPFFGLPFVLVGIGMLLSPLWAYRSAQKTVYGITNKRALIISPAWGGTKSVQSFGDEDVGDITRIEKPDGSGDLFASETYVASRGGRNTKKIGFYGVKDVHGVEKIMRDVFKSEKTADDAEDIFK